jgi:CxxC motif-containing protein (DUF1111 family)
MSQTLRLGFLGLAFLAGSPLTGARAEGEPDAAVALGRELFARPWVPGDARSHGGDGLGPVYNERACLGCHHLGGPGGAAGAERNIEIVTGGDPSAAGSGPGFFYAFGMSFGSAGFQYRVTSNPAGAGNGRRARLQVNLADLVQVHAGFRDTPSVVLHRYGPDPDYRSWREQVPGQHGRVFIRSSQRNPTPLFGTGLIDAIPDDVLEAAARRRFAAWPQVKGRLSRLSDGRIGRFGWKAQTATLQDFVLTAAAVELGLEVPGRPQAGDPRFPALPAPGLDLDQNECDALAAYVRSLPAPEPQEPDTPKEAQQSKAGATLFRSIGCAACHVPKMGAVDGIYSDLLLHDMSPELSDTSLYGAFAARAPAPAGKIQAGASVTEWRTPPLWGLRDSAPYLHDGRAETIDQAIRSHGGQASASAQRYAQLSPRELAQLDAFLRALAAPRAVN